MKQRLLLALLVLFASVGMVTIQAANTVTLKVAANSGDVKVTFTGTGVAISGTGATTENKTFKIPNHANPSGETYTLSSLSLAGGFTFSGNMEELTIDEDALTSISFTSSTLQKLTLANADGLTTLNCNNLGLSALTLTAATGLTSINCSNNQLIALDLSSITASTVNCSNNKIGTLTVNTNVVYANLDCSGNNIGTALTNLQANSKVTYGYQTVAIGSGANKDAIANQLSDIAARATEASAVLNGKLTTAQATWGSQWKKKDANGIYQTTSDAKKDATYPTQFTFYNGDKYTSGDYCFSVEPKDLTTHPIKYWVEIKVKPASFGIQLLQPDKIDGNRGGTVTGSEVGGTLTATTVITDADGKTMTSATQGKHYQFTASPVEGFEFKSFDISANADGFKLIGDVDLSAKMATYELVGLTKYPKELKIKPVFEAKSYTINYSGDQINGKYTVRIKNGEAFTDGKGTAKYGQTVVVSAQPNEGYKTYVTINNTPQEEISQSKEIVITNDMNVAITFKQIASTLSISADREAGYFASVYLNEKSLTAINSGGSPGVWESDVTPQSTVTLKLTMSAARNATTEVINILFMGKSLPITKGKATLSGSGDIVNTYTVSLEIPAQSSDASYGVVIKTVELTATTITPGGSQTFVYDGTAKPLVYTTSPANLDNVKLEYSVTTVANQSAAEGYTGLWTTKTPVNVGKYAARASREADKVYQVAKFNTNDKPVLLTITQAKPVIKTLPTVSIKNINGLFTYSFTGGEACLGTTKLTGHFEVVNDGTTAIDDKQVVKKLTAHTAQIAFFAQTSAEDPDPNFYTSRVASENPIAQTPVKGTDGKSPENYKVTMAVPASSGITVTLKNGTNVLNATPSATASATVVNETLLTFVINNPNGWKITSLTEIADQNPDIIDASTIGSGGSTEALQTYTMTTGVDHAMNIMVNATVVADNKKDYTVTTEEYVVSYANGKALSYDPTGLNKITVKENASATKIVLSYKDADGKVIALPVDAGTYTVEVKITGATVSGSTSFDGEYRDKIIEAKMIVKPRVLAEGTAGGDLKDLVFPTTANPVAVGQKLKQATFTDGSTRVAGSFEWATPDVIAKNGTSYKIVFKPSDAKNYIVKDDNRTIEVTVLNKQLITYGNPTNGKIVVKDDKGGVYLSGDEVTTGTKLIIQGVGNSDFELKSLLINDASVSVSGDTYTYTVEKDKSIAIDATFQVKTAVDPDTQYTVTLPSANAVKGVVINKPGVNAVKKEASFSFTLSSLAADAANIVVKANGETLTPKDGTYTIAKVAANTTVTVTLATPTKIKVSVEKETKNAKGYVMGTVEIEGLAKDSTCYYGDEVTLVAYPESGVTFAGWSDATSNKDKLRTLTITAAATVKPLFAGVPTGIETIETAEVYGANKCIVIKGLDKAYVTIISMDGRSQKQQISGDTRIDAAAGIYGVIIEVGKEVKQMKVAVR